MIVALHIVAFILIAGGANTAVAIGVYAAIWAVRLGARDA